PAPAIAAAAPAPKQILVPLEITPEPRLRLQRVVSVRIDKALDDNQQKLTAQEDGPVPGAAGPFPPGALPPVARMPGPGGMGPPAWAGPGFGVNYGMSQLVHLVRLTAGAKASKSLKELSGTVAVEILSDSEAILTADNLDKAAGQTFRSKDGGALKIIAV